MGARQPSSSLIATAAKSITGAAMPRMATLATRSRAREEKTRNDIWTVDCGFPGVETQMPMMLTEVAAGRYSISDYVRWRAANPAKI